MGPGDMVAGPKLKEKLKLRREKIISRSSLKIVKPGEDHVQLLMSYIVH